MRIPKTFSILFACSIFILSVTQANAKFVSAKILADLAREYDKFEAKNDDASINKIKLQNYYGYIAGVYDATESMFDSPENITLRQVSAIVAKYVKAHRERWTDDSAAIIVIDALKEAFPIKNTRSQR